MVSITLMTIPKLIKKCGVHHPEFHKNTNPKTSFFLPIGFVPVPHTPVRVNPRISHYKGEARVGKAGAKQRNEETEAFAIHSICPTAPFTLPGKEAEGCLVPCPMGTS